MKTYPPSAKIHSICNKIAKERDEEETPEDPKKEENTNEKKKTANKEDLLKKKQETESTNNDQNKGQPLMGRTLPGKNLTRLQSL